MKKIFCFLMVAILCCSFMIVPSFAMNDLTNTATFGDEYPSLTTDTEFNDYIFFTVNGVKVAYFFKADSSKAEAGYDFLFDYDASSRYLRANLSNGTNTTNFNYFSYTYSNGTWSKSESNKASVGLNLAIISNASQIYYSTKNVVSSDGTIFFEVPPAEMTLAEAVLMMVAEEIPETQGTIQQQMMTILLCGVGCLALVISLALLVKTLRRYLPQ